MSGSSLAASKSKIFPSAEVSYGPPKLKPIPGSINGIRSWQIRAPISHTRHGDQGPVAVPVMALEVSTLKTPFHAFVTWVFLLEKSNDMFNCRASHSTMLSPH